jgi:sulfite exporter TauE/SafE
MTELLAGLVLGFAGSAHCAAMCGPLAIALRGRAPGGDRSTVGGAGLFALYHGARLAAYAGLGLGAGAIGHALATMGIGRALSAVAGLALIAGALGSLGVLPAPHALGGVGRAVGRLARAGREATTGHAAAGAAVAGGLNALLPCGMLYAALTAAATFSRAGDAALFMVLFGLGTVPALAACWALAGSFRPAVRHRLRFVVPIALAAVGLQLIVRALPAERPPAAHAGHHAH